ncbi:MAG: AAA family ATPase [Bacteroidales bacterium]|nr:AAA family ATPase [Bacteroidales bacterium]
MIDDVERLIFSHFPHTPTTGQSEACRAIARFLFADDPRSAFVLKGYAGTGKTSLVSALVKAAPQLRLSTVLLAPTGRAAKVFSGYSGHTALTIHKKIYMTVTDATGAVHMAKAINRHAYTLFIVDEASMIGLEGAFGRRSLLEDLADYVYSGSHCRLLLVGDTAQLPPVGSAESPALDLPTLEALTGLSAAQYELTEVVRQQSMSGILRNATALRRVVASIGNGQTPQLPLLDFGGCSDVKRLEGDDVMDTINACYATRELGQTAVVTRSNKRANLYNQGIRNSVLCREEEVGAGDYLMVVRNNYYWLGPDSPMGFIANGDIVEVMAARNFQELYGFRFADATLRFVDYDGEPTIDCKLLLDTLHSESPALGQDESQRLFEAVMEDFADLPNKADRLRQLRLNPYYNALQVKFSYALTCHKTQGGQWPNIIIDQGYFVDDMLDREYLRWLYTAFTRATGRVYLVGFADSFFA